MTTSVNNVRPNDAAQYVTNKSAGNIGKNDFLKLLTTQLQNQDPMNPADEKEMAGTLAQYSALEQAQQTNESLLALAKTNQWTQGLGLLGRTVQGTNENGDVVQGPVTGMLYVGDVLNLRVGDQNLPLTNLSKVSA